MTTSVVNLPIETVLAGPLAKKRVLLIDTSRAQRDMRGETMRRLGMEVDCAADITEARCWWRPDLYDLVLFHVESELQHMYKFWDDIRAATPVQRTAFLVGKPEYLAASPTRHPAGPENPVIPKELTQLNESLCATAMATPPQNWGILEACRRISAVRSLSDARTRALRERPLPSRESLMSD